MVALTLFISTIACAIYDFKNRYVTFFLVLVQSMCYLIIMPNSTLYSSLYLILQVIGIFMKLPLLDVIGVSQFLTLYAIYGKNNMALAIAVSLMMYYLVTTKNKENCEIPVAGIMFLAETIIIFQNILYI